MPARRPNRVSLVARLVFLAAAVAPGSACVSPDATAILARWQAKPDDPVQLPRAEQMIDELDRILTTNGTIGVKTPDVWGQDRLAKFRTEYEAQMADRLKQGFKADINASVSRDETDATLVRAGTMRVARPPKGASPTPEPTPSDDAAQLHAIDQDRAVLDAALPATAPPSTRPASLEPSVILDEQSNYLNHLNQLRRINAGDDLADRPGYGLYLIRIPVTLSPGPRSRSGRGAIISVSARPIVSKHTLRTSLRNVVINETVANLTHAICHRETEAHDQPAPPDARAFSLISFGDTELCYGEAGISRLREEIEHQLARDLGDEPHHRNARVAEWLRSELETSYHLLEQAATPGRPPSPSGPVASAGDPLEEIGDLIARRDFTRIAQLLPRAPQDSNIRQASATGDRADHDHGRRRGDVVDLLAFAMRVHAAGINRRLKQDMVDQEPALNRDALRRLSFFEGEPSDEAVAAFDRYVQAKWPLRVYAIEPVIAQQNVADAYSRRSQKALDLVGSGLAGPARAIAGVTTDHRSRDEETAVRLNPTMVGFGAGRDTFGWIFYPRIQSRGGRDGRLLTDVALLLNGRLPDPTGDDQCIEPGQRECTALIEMPNFVPKVEFVTVANWFRTGEVGGGQRSELEKASVLGRKLVTAENALNRAMGDGEYRPDEYQIARERLEQLRDMMPTQRMVVRVPSSGDNNDARIFCSQGLQLRPLLVGWHGRPPEQGAESTLFLEGKNFSIHDTHVIAGGKPAASVLVSRHLLQVTIAPDASPTPGASGNLLMDITVATPNGVSNHLLIKMAPIDPTRPRVPPPTTAVIPKAPEPAEVRKASHEAGDHKPDKH